MSKWEQVISTVYGEPSNSPYQTRHSVVKSAKIGAKSPQNRRLSQSREEAARATRSPKITINDLIDAGYFRQGTTLQEAARSPIFRAAVKAVQMEVRTRKSKTIDTPSRRAIAEEVKMEKEVSHKNRDSTPAGKSRRNRK